jgi:hypothetical protein
MRGLTYRRLDLGASKGHSIDWPPTLPINILNLCYRDCVKAIQLLRTIRRSHVEATNLCKYTLIDNLDGSHNSFPVSARCVILNLEQFHGTDGRINGERSRAQTEATL